MYQFTRKLPHDTCKICGEKIDKKWGDGGIGATCRNCASNRDDLDLVELGIIRNIKSIGETFEFEANIDGKWYNCARPCGDWCMITNVSRDATNDLFSVPVGYWEARRLFKKYYKDQNIEYKTIVTIQHNKIIIEREVTYVDRGEVDTDVIFETEADNIILKTEKEN